MSHCSNNVTDDRGGASELTESDRYRLLADDRRRAALEVLADRAMPVDLETLAAAVAAREEHIDETREQVAVALHHTHLPKLSDFGVIDYDPGSNRVESFQFWFDSLEA